MASRTLLISVLCYGLALALFISGSSLWTDEAFSAWLASHENFRSLTASLLAGDSSDLQMGLYYVYLFIWAKLFGAGEFALRAANIPFIFLFGAGLVWTSWRIFKSRSAWLAAGMLPFVWHYASEARPYMAVLGFATAVLASLLAFLHAELPAEAKRFPWICLTCILLGSLFHMLFLLVVAPLLLIVVLAYGSDKSPHRWRYWITPLAAFALPLCALASFFVFTFLRSSVAYDYPLPGARQMASVLYELAGLANFGPNRKFSLDFHAHLVPVVIGSLAIFLGAAIAIWPLFRNKLDRTFVLLGAAAALSCVEVVVLSFALRKQFDARHLAALVPIFLFLLVGLVRGSGQVPASRSRSLVVIALLSGAWFAADLRGALLPEYQKEDYRDAVATALSIQMQSGAEIALATDPVAPAYYGLDVRGPAPCYPIAGDCADAFREVAWPRRSPALDADRWVRPRIVNWLTSHRERGIPVEVLIQLDRAHHESDWWPILARYPAAPRVLVHGFEIVILNSASHN